MLVKQFGQFKFKLDEVLVILLKFALQIHILLIQSTVDGLGRITACFLQKLFVDGDHRTPWK